MNKQHRNKYRMSTALEKVLDNNKTKWEKVPAAARNVAALKVFNTRINDLDTGKTEQDTEDRSPKGQAKKIMANLAFHLAQDALAYANEHNDLKLKSQVNFSLSSLLYEGDHNSEKRAGQIADAVEPIFDALKVDAGLADDELAKLRQAIANFVKTNDESNAGDSTSVATNKTLANVFSELSKFLNEKLDPSFARFETTDPEFFLAYQNARSVKELGVRHEDKPQPPTV